MCNIFLALLFTTENAPRFPPGRSVNRQRPWRTPWPARKSGNCGRRRLRINLHPVALRRVLRQQFGVELLNLGLCPFAAIAPAYIGVVGNVVKARCGIHPEGEAGNWHSLHGESAGNFDKIDDGVKFHGGILSTWFLVWFRFTDSLAPAAGCSWRRRGSTAR